MNKVKKTILSKICFYLDELLRMKIINCEEFSTFKIRCNEIHKKTNEGLQKLNNFFQKKQQRALQLLITKLHDNFRTNKRKANLEKAITKFQVKYSFNNLNFHRFNMKRNEGLAKLNSVLAKRIKITKSSIYNFLFPII